MSAKLSNLQFNHEPHTDGIRQAEYEDPVETRLDHERVLVHYFWSNPLEILPSKLLRHFFQQTKNPEAWYINLGAYGGLALLANSQGNLRLFLIGVGLMSVLEHFFGNHVDELEVTYQQQ